MTMETKYLYDNDIYRACHDVRKINRVRKVCGLEPLKPLTSTQNDDYSEKTPAQRQSA